MSKSLKYLIPFGIFIVLAGFLFKDILGSSAVLVVVGLISYIVINRLDAAYTLYAFDNHCADISFGQFGLHGFDVVQREVGDVPWLNER